MITSSSGDDGDAPWDVRTFGLGAALLLIALIALLLGFSVAAIVLQQPALAVMAGTAGVGLAGEAGRRALRPPESHRAGTESIGR